jgi:Sel1 repeat
MNNRLTSDPSFQQLLEAAWVLQCQSDRKLNELHPGAIALGVRSAEDELRVVPLPSQGNVCEVAKTVGERHGVLALVGDRQCSAVRNPTPFPTPDAFKKTVLRENKTTTGQVNGRATVSLLRLKDKDRGASALAEVNFKRMSRAAASYAGPFVVLLIIGTFLFSQLANRTRGLTTVKAVVQLPATADDNVQARDTAGQPQVDVATGSENARTDPSVLEPSHRRITDAATSSVVEDLGRYEMRTLRRQAQYGDDTAALTLGMAYEIGRHVPQSCVQAAHWVAVAAAEGNPAAQYNLGLRYVYGDGTPTNLNEAKKWLQAAASHGHQKAKLNLQLSGL